MREFKSFKIWKLNYRFSQNLRILKNVEKKNRKNKNNTKSPKPKNSKKKTKKPKLK